MAKRPPARNPNRAALVRRAEVAKNTGQLPAPVEQALAVEGQNFGSPFAPGTPLTPYSGFGGEPRRWAFPTGYNIQSRADRDKRVSFSTLKGLIDNYDIARMAIGHRIDDVRSLDWSIVPRRGFNGDADVVVDEAYKVMRYPEGPGSRLPLRAWVAKYLEDVLRYDAGTLYRRRDRAGRVIGLKVVSGTTIAPTLDYWGDTPAPPGPAFVQYVEGMPWKWFTTDDLIYIPFRPQPDSAYGFAPLESVLLTANTDLRFQMYFLAYFTEGTVPEGFAMAPPDISSPDQLAEWQEYWDALLYGDDSAKHQIKWMPHGTEFEFPAIKEFNEQFPLYLMRKVCAAYHVTPNDLGFTEDVNRAVGETQVDVQFRIGTLPLVQHVEDILSAYLQDDRGLPVEFSFDTGQEKEDRVAVAQAHKIYVEMGAESVDEVRSSELGLEVDNERPTPRFVLTSRQGLVPLASLDAIAGRVDPETAAPVDDVPLDEEPFDGTPGLVADKQPGGTEFERAPVNPDEPRFPELEHPVPGTDVVAKPVTKDATAGVTAATGIVGYDLIGDDEEVEPDLVAVEKAAFGRFVKARRKGGKWRDFTFTALDRVEAHRLNDAGRASVRKATGELIAAGLCVRAADTGRVLMLQRALDPTDPAGGCWEFPGGHVEDGEKAPAAAAREWMEETGVLLPVDVLAPLAFDNVPCWMSPNGIYGGYVVTVPSESQIDLGNRDQVTNPDDPDGDVIEAIAWFDPAHLSGNPALRPELAADLALVHRALGVGEVVKGDPKGSWRDGPADTPHARFDLRLTAHYAPLIAAALRGLFTDAQLRAAIETVASAVRKSPAGNAAAGALPEPDPAELDRIIAELVADAYMAGGHAAAEQIGNGAILIDRYMSEVDWSAWVPGDLDAAALTGDGGLAALLDGAGITIRGVLDTTIEQMGNRLADGLAAGDTVDGIAASLVGLLDDPSRAEMIAHTETARAMTAATMGTYTANGLTQWDLITSAGACQTCLDIAAANPHQVGDTAGRPPVHPRCRCAAAPTIPADWLPPDEAQQ